MSDIFDILENVGGGVQDTTDFDDELDAGLEEFQNILDNNNGAGDFSPAPIEEYPPVEDSYQVQPVEETFDNDLFDSADNPYQTTEQQVKNKFENEVDCSQLLFDANEVSRICKEVQSDCRVLLQFESIIDKYIGDAELRNTDFVTRAEQRIMSIMDNKSYAVACSDIQNLYKKIKQSYITENNKLATNINVLRNFPRKVNTLRGYLPLIPNQPAYSKLKDGVKRYATGNIPITNNRQVKDGAMGVFVLVNAKYEKLREEWSTLDTKLRLVQEDLKFSESNMQREEQHMMEAVEEVLSEQRQQIAMEQFDLFGAGSSYGTKIGFDNMSTIIMTCISEHYGGDLSKISSLGIDDNGQIFINKSLFKISNMINLSTDQLAKVPGAYVNQVKAGNWGCMFDYSRIYELYGLVELDLSKAPNAMFDAMKDLHISKGNWGKLFKKMSNLACVHLPEGTATRENYSAWGKFKSMSHYVSASREAQTHQMAIPDMQHTSIINKPPKQKIDIEGGINTFKNSVLWQNPVPRTLIKTFGYGVGVPMYWGLMTALGPIGVVMGAVGVGALAHHEIKHYKDTGSL